MPSQTHPIQRQYFTLDPMKMTIIESSIIEDLVSDTCSIQKYNIGEMDWIIKAPSLSTVSIFFFDGF